MSVEAWVLGEHGDSQMIPWSRVTVGGQPLDMVPGGLQLDRQDIWERTMKAGWSIVLGKGSTEFGIGAAAAQIVSLFSPAGTYVYDLALEGFQLFSPAFFGWSRPLSPFSAVFSSAPYALRVSEEDRLSWMKERLFPSASASSL